MAHEAEKLEELVEILRDRLHERQKQQAMLGIAADPSISLEIRKIETEIHKFKSELEQIEQKKQLLNPRDINTTQNLKLPTSVDVLQSATKIDLSEIEDPFGTVPPNSRFYIERDADDTCWRYISSPYGVTIFIQASRQVGKSSLMLRMLDRAEKELNKRYIFIDFQEFPKKYFANIDEKDFLIELCLMISYQLGIEEAIDEYWQGDSANKIKCGRYLAEHILPKIRGPLILAMDEVDRLSPSPFRDDFFAMLRVWHNKRAYDKQFRKMSLFLSSSTEAAHLVRNEHQSPFNVANYVFLRDFTKEEVADLNRRHNTPLTDHQVNDLIEWIDGHPFLTRLAFYQLVLNKISVSTLFSESIVDEEHFEFHLRYYLYKVFDSPAIKRAMLDICQYHVYEENHHFHRLKEAGLIKKVGKQVLPRNKLYEDYFKMYLQ